MSELAAAYVARLGFTDAQPTIDTMGALHRAHLEQLPYNNLDIVLGSPQPVDEESCLRQAVETGRSGYCFHQNGALAAGLRHPDVGLGEGFVDPVPLVVGTVGDGLLDVEITELDDAGWSFRNDPRGAFTGMEARSLPMDVTGAHTALSTPPDGAFAKILVVQRRTPEAVDTVRACVHTRLDAGGATKRDLTTYDDWRVALVSLGLSLTRIPDERLRALWDSSWQSHVAWDAAGRP